MTDTLTDEKLSEVAEALAVDKNLPKLGLKLGFRQSKVELYIGINRKNDSFEGTTAMLFDWKKKTQKAKQIPDLVKALTDSGLVEFVDEFFPAGDKTTSFPSPSNTITSTSTADTTTPTTTAAPATTTTSRIELPPSTNDYNDFSLEVALRVHKDSRIDILGIQLTAAEIHGTTSIKAAVQVSSSTVPTPRFARDQDVNFRRPVKDEEEVHAVSQEVAGDILQNGPGTCPGVVSCPPVLSERKTSIKAAVQVYSTMSMSRIDRDQDVKFNRRVENEKDFEAFLRDEDGFSPYYLSERTLPEIMVVEECRRTMGSPAQRFFFSLRQTLYSYIYLFKTTME